MGGLFVYSCVDEIKELDEIMVDGASVETPTLAWIQVGLDYW